MRIGGLLFQKLFSYQMGQLNGGFGVGLESTKSERCIPNLFIILEPFQGG